MTENRKITEAHPDDKGWELGRDIQETVLELTFDDAEAEARSLDRRLSRDANVSNEARGQLVWDCFCDYAEAFDLPCPTAEFNVRFPEFANV